MSSPRSLRVLALACLLVFFSRVSAGQGTILSIDINGPAIAASMRVGEPSFTFTADGHFEDGGTARLSAASGLIWKSEKPEVVEIGRTTGVAIFHTVDHTRIWAQDSNGYATKPFQITVLAEVALTPSEFHINTPADTEKFYVGTMKLPTLRGTSLETPLVPAGPKLYRYSEVRDADITWSSDDKSVDFDQKGSFTTINASPGLKLIATSKKGLPPQEIRLVISAAAAPVMAVAGTAPTITSLMTPGEHSLMVSAGENATVSLRAFDPDVTADCSEKDFTKGKLLSIALNDSSTSTSSAQLHGLAPHTLTFNEALVAGSKICVTDNTMAVGSGRSTGATVSDPDDYGRVRSYFIAGVQVSNQLAATASSTAGQYLEAGLNYSFIRAKDGSEFLKEERDFTRRHPGLSTTLDIRLSPIPVSAPATTLASMSPGSTTVTAAPGGTTTTTTIPPSTVMAPIVAPLLTSQQSVRVLGNIYMPFMTTHWNQHVDHFTVGPVVRGGFATLLNPSVGSMQSSAPVSSASSGLTTAMFASAYSFFGAGARLAWERYPRMRDKAPQTITQFLITLGSYSSLPSYVCKAGSGEASPTFTSSACGAQNMAFAKLPIASRTLVPRLDIEGFAKLPNYPFVVGMDANLAQYTLFTHGSLIDYLNKPGNDIRVFVGLKVDLNSLIARTGVSVK